ncbi:MAG: DUF1080 domain-containing protein [Planctomycetota bacterium]|nr:DUF1080 domain-containing protein [Planctomycetota bacterium]MDA1179128.1 DUF1080 domain-containing protein [Planctomycetota bacterium]
MPILLRRTLFLTVLAGPLIGSLAGSVEPVTEGSLVPIFNGKDLTDWEGDSRLWSVRDGAIRGETTEQNQAQGNTFLIWNKGTVRDFELRLSFRCNATNNSGIQYRSQRITDDTATNPWVVAGYQHEIRNEHRFPDVAGFIYDERGSRGRLCFVGEQSTWHADGKQKISATLIEESDFQKLFQLDHWNDVVIVAQGNRIRHFMNDKLIVDFTDLEPKLALSEGVLALQLHAGAPMWVEFKDIQLKTLR